MNEIMKRRGTFKISRELIIDNPEGVIRIMGNMLIVRAEHLFMADVVEYQAYSPLFREVQEGEETPTYVFCYDGETLVAEEVN